MYNAKNTQEKESTNKYLRPLKIYENCIFTNIEFNGTGQYKTIDYTIESTEGEGIVTGRFFDFNYNPTFKDASGQPIPQEKQLEEFLQKVKALFGNGTSEEKWTKGFEVRNPQTFQDLAILLKMLCVGERSEKFRLKTIMNVKDGKGYAAVPHYTGGVTERMTVAKADSKLYHSKNELAKADQVQPQGTEAVNKTDQGSIPAAKSESDDLPF